MVLHGGFNRQQRPFLIACLLCAKRCLQQIIFLKSSSNFGNYLSYLNLHQLGSEFPGLHKGQAPARLRPELQYPPVPRPAFFICCSTEHTADDEIRGADINLLPDEHKRQPRYADRRVRQLEPRRNSRPTLLTDGEQQACLEYELRGASLRQ